MKTLILLASLLTLGFVLPAQTQIIGMVTDSLSGEPLVAAQLVLVSQNSGTTTDAYGRFELTVKRFPAKVRVSFLGYRPVELQLTEAPREAMIVRLSPMAMNLGEVDVLADLAEARHSPISFSTIKSAQIRTELGDRPLPEIIAAVPGVYAARDGGGSGDASISIRGFQQENIAVLLNGVPINGAENGLVYWNNWIGLTEATSGIQIQKGIGASKVALNSVGGTINIVTSPATEAGASLSFQTTDYGNQKAAFSYQSGKTVSGWALQLMGSRTKGPGYIDGTYVDAWAYFVGLGKNFGPKHRILFTAMGGPERHGQRNLKLSQEEVDRYGNRYNKDWGSYNGEINNASENFYHKPHLAFNHYWQLTPQALLATSIYFTPGWGGGKWSDNFNYGPGIFDFRNPSGQIDWDAIYHYNATNTDQYVLQNGDTVGGYANLVQTHFLASHVWTGLVSSLDWNINPSTKLTTGIHYRYFASHLSEKVADLLGGAFYLDDYSWSLAGNAGRNEIKMPGDVIRINNGSMLHNTSLFAQIEKTFGKVNAFVGGTISDANYRRHDPYNYPAEPYSKWVSKQGADLKAGINLNLDKHQNIYLNGGLFSKTPYYKYVFGNFTNVPVRDLGNEKVMTVELGYAFRKYSSYLLGNVYYTSWKDVSFLSNEYIQLENGRTRAMVNGLDALHKGLELEAGHGITNNFSIGGLFSLGDWKWKNDVNAKLLNDNNVVVDTVNVYANGLKVGGHPQLQAGLFAKLQLLRLIELKAEWNYYDQRYASFDPTQRQDPDDRRQSYRLPSYNAVNLYLSLPLKVFGNEALVFANCNNLTNNDYIIKGEDGAGHDIGSFRGFWSFGRTFSVGFNVKL